MLANILNTAFRNFYKYKLNTLINIGGLAVGLAVSMIIVFFIKSETQFDTMHQDNDRIYRINWKSAGSGETFATFFNPLSPILTENIKEIESYARLGQREMLMNVNGKKSFETFSLVDPSFFDFFNYGDQGQKAALALQDKSNAVLTVAAAEKIFGVKGDPSSLIGKSFSVDSGQSFKVAAVVNNSPVASHLVSNIFLSVENLPELTGNPNFWNNTFSDWLYHYIKLAPDTNPKEVEGAIFNYMVTNVNKEVDGFLTIALQSLKNIHFTQDLQNEMSTKDLITGDVKPHRNKNDIYIFMAVGLLTIIIGTFNFMNLQIAQASKRVNEVGVRKVVGALRKDIALQFIIESLIMAGISFLLALVMVDLALPSFGLLLGTTLGGTELYNPIILVLGLIISLLVGVLAGLYPALFIAQVKPSEILKGGGIQTLGSARLRAWLVVLQFAISIGLIISSSVINSQILYAFSQGMGFNTEKVVKISLSNKSSIDGYYNSMKTRLLNYDGIVDVSSGSAIPTGDLSDGISFVPEGDGANNTSIPSRLINIDQGYFKTLGMQMIAGRDFTPIFKVENEYQGVDLFQWPDAQTPSRQGKLIINETMSRSAGWSNPQDAVGQFMTTQWTRNNVDLSLKMEIIGVVADAHYNSIRTDIPSLTYFETPTIGFMVVKVNGDLSQALEHIKQVWSETIIDEPIRLTFLDDDFQNSYSEEIRAFDLFIVFSVIAILIAGLGLYGLVSFMADRRIKEIGIRKVLGATTMDIILLLTSGFSKQVILANLVAWPIAFFAMDRWLQTFAYRDELNYEPFVTAGLIAFFIAILTVSLKAYGVARQNPIIALRHE